MGSQQEENPNLFYDFPLCDMAVAGVDFSSQSSVFCSPSQGLINSYSTSVDIGASYVDYNSLTDSGSRKRVRSESSNAPGSKACREKMRRDKLNDRFLELGSILDPGKPPKMDKAAILSDAALMVTQLRTEAQKLKDSNENLHKKIKELKAEKNELRDEKQRLKADKENLEQQIKMLNTRQSFMAHSPVMPTAFAPQGQPAGHKLMMPIIGYPGFPMPMWQLMPPADVDVSQDAESRPPVA